MDLEKHLKPHHSERGTQSAREHCFPEAVGVGEESGRDQRSQAGGQGSHSCDGRVVSGGKDRCGYQ